MSQETYRGNNIAKQESLERGGSGDRGRQNRRSSYISIKLNSDLPRKATPGRGSSYVGCVREGLGAELRAFGEG